MTDAKLKRPLFLAWTLGIGGLILTAVLLWTWFRPEAAGFNLPTPPVPIAHEYEGTLTISKVSFDSHSARATGDLRLRARPVVRQKSRVIEVGLGLLEEGSDAVAVHYYTPGTGLKIVQESDAAGQLTEVVELRTSVVLPGKPNRDEISFPFDSYTVEFDVDACVLTRTGKCAEPNIWVNQARLTAKDAFDWRLAGTRFTLDRPMFVRAVLVAVLGAGLVLLITTQGQNELLAYSGGFIAAFFAVRGWIVPPVLPCLFDYGAVAVLVIAFFTGLVRGDFRR